MHQIRDMDIHNGDDCITIKSGSRDVLIERVRCQSSHGITIGSVWYDDVRNVTYRNCTLTNCLNGPRIKGRRQGNATVADILFDNIRLEAVGNGVQIDMDYETPGTHPMGSGVTATNVTFMNVRGTAKTPGQLQCLTSRPCAGVRVSNVDLSTAADRAPVGAASERSWVCSGLTAPQWTAVEPVPPSQCTQSP
jgi:polygalacturonase